MEFLKELSRRHEALKKRIHSFRIPLSPTGQRAMGFIYFCIPVVGGYFLMQMVGAQADRNLKDLPLGLNKEVAEEQKAALKQLLDKHNPSNPRS